MTGPDADLIAALHDRALDRAAGRPVAAARPDAAALGALLVYLALEARRAGTSLRALAEAALERVDAARAGGPR